MAEQAPSVGRVVHFVYGDEHYAAIITAAHSRLIEHAEGEERVTEGQTFTVFPPSDPAFTTVAAFDPAAAPATWHWPEHVPARG